MKKTMLSIAIGLVASLLLFATGGVAVEGSQDDAWGQDDYGVDQLEGGAPSTSDSAVKLRLRNIDNLFHKGTRLLGAFGVDTNNPKFVAVYADAKRAVKKVAKSDRYRDLMNQYDAATANGEISDEEFAPLLTGFIMLLCTALAEESEQAETPEMRDALKAVMNFAEVAAPEKVEVGKKKKPIKPKEIVLEAKRESGKRTY